MASKRELKNDLKFYVSELISECFAYTFFVPEADLKSTEEIINDIVEFYGKTLIDINAVKKLAKAERGDNMKAIRNDIEQKIHEFIGRMAKLNSK